MTASPVCVLNSTSLAGWTSTALGVTTAASEVVSVKLASYAGVRQWSLSILTADENCTLVGGSVYAAPTITAAAHVYDSATYTAPATHGGIGTALIFRSSVLSTLGEWSHTTFASHVLTGGGARVGAVGETTECGVAGWAAKINGAIRGVSVAADAASIQGYAVDAPFAAVQSVMAYDGSGNLHMAPIADAVQLGTSLAVSAFDMGGQVVGSAANGVASTDLATVAQLPVAGTTSGTFCAGDSTKLPPAPAAAGRIIYDTGSAWSTVNAGTAGQILQANGAAAPTWANAGGVATAGWQTAMDIDFTALSATDFKAGGDGAYTVSGFPCTSAGSASVNTFGIGAASAYGLRVVGKSSTIASATLNFLLTDMIAGLNWANSSIRVWTYLAFNSTPSGAGSASYAYAKFLWSSSGGLTYVARKYKVSTAYMAYSSFPPGTGSENAQESNTGTVTPDTLLVEVPMGGRGSAMFTGTYSSGFPAMTAMNLRTMYLGGQTTTNTVVEYALSTSAVQIVAATDATTVGTSYDVSFKRIKVEYR